MNNVAKVGVLVAFFLVVLTMFSSSSQHIAADTSCSVNNSAACFDVQNFQGYFTGQTNISLPTPTTPPPADPGALFTTGTQDTTSISGMPVPSSTPAQESSELITIITDRLNETGPYGATSQDQIGAAFIIDTMLDHTGFSSVQSGINYAQDNLDKWEAYVNYYAEGSNGYSLQAGVYQTFQAGFSNTFFSPAGDDAFYQDQNSTTTRAIIFYINGNPVYMIKEDCGNVALASTVPPPPNPVISGTVYGFNGTGSTELSGVSVYTSNCDTSPSGAITTGSNSKLSAGQFQFTEDIGSNFCISVPSTYSSGSTTWSVPIITPGYIEPSGAPPGVNTSCGGNSTYYQTQTASYSGSPGPTCDYNLPGGNSGYDIAYTKNTTPTKKPPTIPISGTVYGYNTATDKVKTLEGVSITDCNGDTSSTGGQGGFNFSQLTQGESFCVHAPSTFTDSSGATWSNPYITSSHPPINYPPASCDNDANYDGQTANSPSTGTCSPGNNTEYNFEYGTCSGTACTSVPPNPVTVSGTVYGYNYKTGNVGTLGNVAVTDCNSHTSTTGSPGGFNFSQLSKNESFCVHVPSTTTYEGINYSDPVITSSNPPTKYPPDSCDGGVGYDSQVANSPSTGPCSPGDNTKYNFEYNSSCGSGCPQPKTVTISGTVYYFNGGGSTGLTGVKVYDSDCGNPTSDATTTGANNDEDNDQFDLTLNTGTAFCIGVPQKTTIGSNTYSDPVVTPGYIASSAIASDAPSGCSASYYESQKAASGDSSGACNYNLPGGNTGYNIAYQTCTGTCTPTNNPNPCPPFAADGYSDISKVPVSLPVPSTILPTDNNNVPAVGSVGSGSGEAETYTLNSPATEVKSIADSDPATDFRNVTASVNGSKTVNPVNLDYTNYYNTYAYDPDTPVVSYVVHYTETDTFWAYDGPPQYSTYCETSTTNPVTGIITCTKTGTELEGYTVVIQPSTTKTDTSAILTQAGPTMPECFDRQFTLAPQTGVAAWQKDHVTNDENPDTAHYSSSVLTTFKESSMPDMPNATSSGSVHTTYLRTISQVLSPPAVTKLTAGICHEDTTGAVKTNLPDPPGNTPCQSAALDTDITYPESACSETTPTEYKADVVSPQGSVDSLSVPLLESVPDEVAEPGSGQAGDPAGYWQGSYTIIDDCPASVDGPNNKIYYGDMACFTLSATPASGYIDSTGTVQGLIPSTQTSPIGNCTDYLTAKPYLKVYGGDVSAGTDSNQLDACYDGTNAEIEANNLGSPSYAGSGTSLAAIAQIAITGFASAQNDPEGAMPPKGLTFANNDPSYLYGGYFDTGSSACPPTADGYYEQLSANGPVYPTATVSDPQTALNDIGSAPGDYAYQVTGGGSIGATTISPGQHIALYVNGAVNITGDITYGATSGGATNVADLPSFEIINKNSSINVEYSVGELDGSYIAEGGTINDCTDAAGNTLPVANWVLDTRPGMPNPSATCSKQLKVVGTFMADTVNLDRTNGSYHDATSTESAPSANAAEEFDYTPLQWLIPNPAQELNQSQQTPAIQSITSLPPIL